MVTGVSSTATGVSSKRASTRTDYRKGHGSGSMKMVRSIVKNCTEKAKRMGLLSSMMKKAL